jgi:hypothetical protein
MNVLRIALLGLALAAGSALTLPAFSAPAAAATHRATPTPAPTPVPPADPAVTKAAFQQFVAWQLGIIDRTRYTDEMNVLITPEKLTQSAKGLSALGALETAEYLGPKPASGVPPGSKTYVYRMHCSLGAVFMQFSVAPDGKVAAIIFRDNLTDF